MITPTSNTTLWKIFAGVILVSLAYCFLFFGVVFVIAYNQRQARLSAASGPEIAASTGSNRQESSAVVLVPSPKANNDVGEQASSSSPPPNSSGKIKPDLQKLDQELNDVLDIIGQQKYQEAEQKLTELMRQYPKDARLYYIRGCMYSIQCMASEKGSEKKKFFFSMAMLDIDKGLEIDPSLAKTKPGKLNVYFFRAKLFLDQENWVEAILEADKAIALDSQLADAYMTRGIAYWGLSTTEELPTSLKHMSSSVIDMRRAAELDSKHKRAYESAEAAYKKVLLLTGLDGPN